MVMRDGGQVKRRKYVPLPKRFGAAVTYKYVMLASPHPAQGRCCGPPPGKGLTPLAGRLGFVSAAPSALLETPESCIFDDTTIWVHIAAILAVKNPCFQGFCVRI